MSNCRPRQIHGPGTNPYLPHKPVSTRSAVLEHDCTEATRDMPRSFRRFKIDSPFGNSFYVNARELLPEVYLQVIENSESFLYNHQDIDSAKSVFNPKRLPRRPTAHSQYYPGSLLLLRPRCRIPFSVFSINATRPIFLFMDVSSPLFSQSDSQLDCSIPCSHGGLRFRLCTRPRNSSLVWRTSFPLFLIE